MPLSSHQDDNIKLQVPAHTNLKNLDSTLEQYQMKVGNNSFVMLNPWINLN